VREAEKSENSQFHEYPLFPHARLQAKTGPKDERIYIFSVNQMYVSEDASGDDRFQ
jgi:hypothetical protein